MKLLHFAFIGAFPGPYPKHNLRSVPNLASIAPLNSGAIKLNAIGSSPLSVFKRLACKMQDNETADQVGGCNRIAGDVSRPVSEILSEALLPELVHLPIKMDRVSKTSKSIHQVWRPLTKRGTLSRGALDDHLLKRTSVGNVDVDQLVFLAKKISESNGVSSASVLEIKECLLNGYALSRIIEDIDVSTLFPEVEKIDVRARSLVIRAAGSDSSHFALDATDEKDYLGLVEVTLNSTHTGGELEVASDGEITHLQTARNNWMAVSAEASCSICPVVSGTRVSLVCDIYGVPVIEAPTFLSGNRRFAYWGYLLEHSERFNHDEVAHLTHVAKYLRPKEGNTSTTKFEIDAIFLNEDGLPNLLDGYNSNELQAKVKSMFPQRKLDFRPTKLQLRLADISGQSDPEIISSNTDKTDGYLGTLVVGGNTQDPAPAASSSYKPYRYFDTSRASTSTSNSASTAGSVNVITADGANRTVELSQDYWYAVAAGGSSTVSSITSGSRISVHFDIYDVTPEHDPLSHFSNKASTSVDISDSMDKRMKNEDDGDSSGSDDYWTDDSWSDDGWRDDSDSDVDYYSDADATGHSATLTEPQTALSDADVPGTDSDLTVYHPPVTRTAVSDKVKLEVLNAVEAELLTNNAVVIALQHVYPKHQHSDVTSMRGGDQALYKVLTNTASQYDFQVVELTLQSARDPVTGQNTIISGTLSTDADSMASTTKLIVPITLNSEHQSADNNDTYTVTGLRVTKRKKL